MKTSIIITVVFFNITVLLSNVAFAQKETKPDKKVNDKSETMKTYLIEREIPEAGKFSDEDLKGISQKSCNVLKEMGPGIEWVNSYVTDNKIYCIHKAENKELIKEHAKKGGFPANSIKEVSAGISPDTAKE